MRQRHTYRIGLVVLAFYAGRAVPPASGEARQETAPSSESASARATWLVIERVGSHGRSPVHTDPIEAQIVAGEWSPPKAGDTVHVSDEITKTWQEAAPDEDGWLRHEALNGGYACMTVDSDTERVMLLDASGHSMVYVNGEPRAGDPYGSGWVLLPVHLNAGVNTFLFAVGRGQLRAELIEPRAEIQFTARDATLPDLILGESGIVWGAVPVVNTTPEPMDTLLIDASYGAPEPTRTAVPSIPPMSTRKVGFRLAVPEELFAEDMDVKLDLYIARNGAEDLVDTQTCSLRVRDPEDKHKRTFVSEIDGSVQYFAATPAHPSSEISAPPALFLTLHGAGVEATNQANAYAPKTWGYVVAPTNRRPYGFDWEDWGRLDALEVLALAQERWGIDPDRVYLTGHSMGGHGVWQIGATYPDKFAAIGPSAAWPDFWSYAGAAEFENPTPIEQILTRAAAPSRTLTLVRNTLHYGVYILHGEKDDNVPVSLAREMLQNLAEFHTDLVYYEKPGAGHWWGNECVDWPPMFDFFGYHTRPQTAKVQHIEFHTANPGVSASSHWVTLEAQLRQLEPSSVRIDLDPQTRTFTGTTQNVARLSIDTSTLSAEPALFRDAPLALAPDAPLTINLDEQLLENVPWPENESRIWLRRDGEQWTVVSRPDSTRKCPHRYGPFKQAFRNRFLFVYGTRGNDAFNAAVYNKARYDAETFWYRGNGSVDVVPDVAFDPSAERDRNIILYGNADTNAAWTPLLSESPVQVRSGAITIGQRELTGDDLACLFIRPRPGSDRAAVGVVAGTGNAGMRLTQRLPYFVSGVAYPDCTVLGLDVLTGGSSGVRAAGFFGIDWGIDSGEFAWRE